MCPISCLEGQKVFIHFRNQSCLSYLPLNKVLILISGDKFQNRCRHSNHLLNYKNASSQRLKFTGSCPWQVEDAPESRAAIFYSLWYRMLDLRLQCVLCLPSRFWLLTIPTFSLLFRLFRWEANSLVATGNYLLLHFPLWAPWRCLWTFARFGWKVINR